MKFVYFVNALKNEDDDMKKEIQMKSVSKM